MKEIKNLNLTELTEEIKGLGEASFRAKQIYEWLVADLTETYNGRAPKWRIESVAEDITESICLKLNIRQKGIRK